MSEKIRDVIKAVLFIVMIGLALYASIKMSI